VAKSGRWHGILLQQRSQPIWALAGWHVTLAGIVWGIFIQCISERRAEKRISVLCLVATLYSIVMWMTGYYLEKRGINCWFQANSIKSRRVLSYLTLSKNVIRQSPGILAGMNPDSVYEEMARAYRDIIMIY